MSTMSAGARFRSAIQQDSPLQVMGAITAYAGLMAKRVGYRALYLSGGGVAANSLGVPDLGISTMEDVLTDARRIVDATGMPLLVDIDTGHEPVKLSPGQISDLRVFPRPLVSAMHCQLFIDQYKTICIAVQGLDPVPASATEQKQRTGCRIQLQLFFHDCTKSVNRFAHIGVTADNVDPFQP